MTALSPKKKGKSSSKKMVGSFLSQPTSEKLHLYAFAYEKSVSEVLDVAATEWVKQYTPAEETMVGLITSRTRAEYQCLKPSEQPVYVKELRSKLESKLISDSLVDIIITGTIDGAE